MKKPLYLLLLLVLIYSCGEKVSFEEPQPAHMTALNEIPQKYWGTYFDEEDSAIVEINAHTISETIPFELSEPLDEILEELEEGEGAEGVKILNQTDNEITFEIYESLIQTFSIKNDSIFGTVSIPDTLFSLDQQDIVKRYKNHDYFNVLNSDGDYYLRKVSFEDDILTISKIKKVLDVKNLISIERMSDATGKGLKPTKRQFKKITQSSFKIDKKLRRIN